MQSVPPTSQATIPRPSFQELLSHASVAASRNELQIARQFIEQALPLEPQHAVANYLHGAVCFQLDDPESAIPGLQFALDSNVPNLSGRAATNLALALRSLERWSEAIDTARRAVRLQPKLIAAHMALTHALRGAARHKEALVAAREALRLHDAHEPQPPEATCDAPATTVGELLVDMGELQEAWQLALRAADEAGRAGGAMALACTLAGRVQVAAGQYESALDAFEKAKALDPSRAARPSVLRLEAITPALRAALPARPHDVFIATFPKSGTTWMQQVVCMLCGEDADVDIQMRAPYIEAALATCAFTLAALRNLPSPRIFKTHAASPDLPVSGCVHGAPPSDAKVVVVVRDPRDVMVSLYYHSRSIKGISWQGTWDEWFEAFLDGSAPVPMATERTPEERASGGPNRSEWSVHTLGWWAAARAWPSRVLWVRYEDLLENPLLQVRAVSNFLGGPFAGKDEATLERIVAASSFGAMKQRHAASHGAEMRNDGGSDHFRKGRKGDWRDHFSAAQRVRFCEVLRQRLVGSGLEEAFDAGMDDE